MLMQLCSALPHLTPADLSQLEEVSRQLPLMAELTGADVFIDCPTADGRAVVVAQARPSSVGSAYQKDVVGEFALPDKEPAVFHAMQLQTPVRDLKAITQENRTVRQDVVPIFSVDGRCIAVLIQEKDVSEDLLQEKKYQSLASVYESQDQSLRSTHTERWDELALREVHHRVKNNLQLVASILNLQARRCKDDFTRKILRENVGRVLSIASIHDILTKETSVSHEIDSLLLLDKLRINLLSFVPEGKQISISVTGDHTGLSSDAASAVSLVVNELITNALEHAFDGRDRGSIHVSFCVGSLFHTITVADDGCGFDVAAPRTVSLGLNIVEATVRDRLRGQLSLHSDSGGSRISFDFKTT